MECFSVHVKETCELYFSGLSQLKISFSNEVLDISIIPWVLSPGVKRGRGVTLTTHPHLVPRLRMSGSYNSSPPMCLYGV
jgi:hypothetical protein